MTTREKIEELLEAGDYVSADARIISSEALEVNESTLTGESKSIKKDNNDITEEKELYERKNMVYAGCFKPRLQVQFEPIP
jgi:Ca2+-transporting ATPase